MLLLFLKSPQNPVQKNFEVLLKFGKSKSFSVDSFLISIYASP